MKKRILGIATAALALIGFTGCGPKMAGIEAPVEAAAAHGAKPKIYVVSHTQEKFKGIKPHQAVWNGLTPLIVKHNQIMQCDFTPEAVVKLSEMGYEIVGDPKEADYRLDTEVVACGCLTWPTEEMTRSSGLYFQRKEIPLKKKPLYKDFMNHVSDEDAPPYFKEIAEAFNTDPDRAMRLFHENATYRDLRRIDDSAPWKYIWNDGANYQIARTKGYLNPNKYKGITPEEIEILKKWAKQTYDVKDVASVDYGVTHSLSFINLGQALSGGGHSTAGGVAAGVGVAMALFGSSPPEGTMRYKLTRMSDGKTVQKDFMEQFFYHYEWNSIFGYNAMDSAEKKLAKLFNLLEEN